MKTFRLSLMVLAMTCAASAFATGTPVPKPTPAVNPQASAGANAWGAANIDLSLSNPVTAGGGSAAGGNANGSVTTGSSYSLVNGGQAPILPSGLCPQNDGYYFSFLWGALTFAPVKVRTEMECLDKVLATLREIAPKPVVVNYLADLPVPPAPAASSVAPAACTAPPAAPASKPKSGKTSKAQPPRKCTLV